MKKSTPKNSPSWVPVLRPDQIGTTEDGEGDQGGGDVERSPPVKGEVESGDVNVYFSNA